MDRRYADWSVRGIGGCCGSDWKADGSLCFGSLSWCFSVLCGDRSGADAPVWRAALVKRNVFSDLRPGSVLAL